MKKKQKKRDGKAVNYKGPSKVFRALGSASGIRILLLLGSVREMCVSDIAKQVKLSMSATSHQLQRMESAGLIESSRDGRTICYMVRRSRLTDDFIRCIKKILQQGRR